MGMFLVSNRHLIFVAMQGGGGLQLITPLSCLKNFYHKNFLPGTGASSRLVPHLSKVPQNGQKVSRVTLGGCEPDGIPRGSETIVGELYQSSTRRTKLASVQRVEGFHRQLSSNISTSS